MIKYKYCIHKIMKILEGIQFSVQMVCTINLAKTHIVYFGIL